MIRSVGEVHEDRELSVPAERLREEALLRGAGKGARGCAACRGARCLFASHDRVDGRARGCCRVDDRGRAGLALDRVAARPPLARVDPARLWDRVVMRGLIDCPSCFTQVLPKRDGTCPSCGESTVAQRGPGEGDGPYRASAVAPGAERASVDVGRGANVGDLCFQCGVATDQRVLVRRELRRGGIPRWFVYGVMATIAAGIGLLFLEWALGVLVLLAVLGAALGTLRWMFFLGSRVPRPEVTDVEARVPQCAECKRSGTLEPTHVDFHRMVMTFVVPRAVAKRVRSRMK